jgi:hypothetical protein
MTNYDKLKGEFINWIQEAYGHGGNPGTDEQDNAVADWFISKLKEREERIDGAIEEAMRPLDSESPVDKAANLGLRRALTIFKSTE